MVTSSGNIGCLTSFGGFLWHAHRLLSRYGPQPMITCEKWTWPKHQSNYPPEYTKLLHFLFKHITVDAVDSGCFGSSFAGVQWVLIIVDTPDILSSQFIIFQNLCHLAKRFDIWKMGVISKWEVSQWPRGKAFMFRSIECKVKSTMGHFHLPPDWSRLANFSYTIRKGYLQQIIPFVTINDLYRS